MHDHKHCQLAASIICGNSFNLESDLAALEKGGIDYIHFDVMDGVFVPRFGLFPEYLKAIRSKTNLPIEVHMMVQDPEPYIQDFVNAGATMLTPHIEPLMHVHRTVMKIKSAGVQAGLALNPGTPLSSLDSILEDLDLVMLMAINPGIVGHKLIPRTMGKIAELRKKIDETGKDIMIEIDGGVTPTSGIEMVRAGANMLVCGTGTIFQPPAKLDDKIREFRLTL
ncbi:MAG: ribulose-phosphate 3-epimerase [Candidatus Moranbacteria bacterium]|nr:ribulose-phosphate 3-epimerase [Candidatus Moranbacteria bacterium]MDD3964938.1 ribulose-phosphate 3-epimerase [Candidatus Moranbacteria bacterium]